MSEGRFKRLIRGERRAQHEGGRRIVHKVLATETEELVLATEAARRGITVARLLVEAATSPTSLALRDEAYGQHLRREALYEELISTQRALTRIGTNINQIAAAANSTGNVEASPEQLAALWRMLRKTVDRIDAALYFDSPSSGVPADDAGALDDLDDGVAFE